MWDTITNDGLWLFSIPGIIGTGVFVLKLILMSIGGFADGLDMDADVDIDGDFDIAAEADLDVHDGAADSTLAFEWLSIQTISGFLMGFGGGGIVGKFGMGWEMPASVALGLGMGVGTVWIIVWMMRLMYSLQSSGNINLRDAIGLEGRVYTRIPAAGEGRGQVRVVIAERMRMFAAVSDGGEISSQAAVRIIRANGDNTLTVTAQV